MKRIKSLATLLLMGIPAWVVLAGIFHLEPTSILVHVDEPGVTVWVDDLSAKATTNQVGPFDVKPGEYRVRVVREGFPVFNRIVAVEPGESVEVWAHWEARLEAASSAIVEEITSQNQKLSGHFGTVVGLGVSQGGSRLISAGADGTLRTWEAGTGDALETIEAHVGAVSGMTLLADGRRAVTAGDDGMMRLWDIGDGTLLGEIHCGTDSALRCTAASSDGRFVAIGSVSGDVQVFEIGTGRELVRHSTLPSSPVALAFSPDGRTLLVSMIGTRPVEHRVEVWDALTGAVRHTLAGHAGPAWCVAVLPDNRRALSGGSDRTLRLWDIKKGIELKRMADHPGAVFSVALTADGRRALAGTSHVWDGGRWADAEAYGAVVWDLEVGKAVGRFETQSPVRSLAVSPDGRRVFAGGEDRLVVSWQFGEKAESTAVVAETQSLNEKAPPG